MASHFVKGLCCIALCSMAVFQQFSFGMGLPVSVSPSRPLGLYVMKYNIIVVSFSLFKGVRCGEFSTTDSESLMNAEPITGSNMNVSNEMGVDKARSSTFGGSPQMFFENQRQTNQRPTVQIDDRLTADDNMSTSENLTMSSNGSHSKSDLYLGIFNSLPNLIRGGRLMITSFCKNRCGESLYCSCKPVCILLKTCCIDFVEACGDRYDIAKFVDDYQWLREVDYECIAKKSVVSSCFKRKPETTTPFEYTNPQEVFDLGSNKSDSSYLETYGDIISQSEENLTLVDVFRLVLSVPRHQREMYLGEVEKIIMDAPLLDASTGITYKNISIYSCNGANLSHAHPWSYYFHSKKDIIDSSEINTADDILAYRNGSFCYKLPYRIVVLSDNVEYCHNREVIETCPDSFLDHDVKEACENVMLPFVLTRAVGNVSITEYYKNPFCIFCNLDLKSYSKIYFINLNYYIYFPTLCTAGGMYLDFELSGAFTINQQHIQYDNLSHTWRKLACSIFPSHNSATQRKNSTKELTTETNTTVPRMLNTKCHLYDCTYRYTGCYRRWVFLIMFPPSNGILGNDRGRAMLDEFKEYLTSNTPGAMNRTEPLYTFLRILNPRPIKGYLYSYFFYIGVNAQLTGDPYRLLVRLHKPLVELVTRMDFPFQPSKNYFTFTFPLTNAINASLDTSKQLVSTIATGPGRYEHADTGMRVVGTKLSFFPALCALSVINIFCTAR